MPSNFALALVGGLSANVGLMHLTAMHKGCANVCTLCQFLFGLFDGLKTPVKRRALSRRQLSMFHHCVFAFTFFLGPFLGNLAVTVTNQDFYPVFLVVRSCGAPPHLDRECACVGEWCGSEWCVGVCGGV